MMMFGLVVYFSGLVSLMFNQNHFLMILMCLEFMYLGVLINVVILMGYKGLFIDVLMFMILVVCEAGLGLSILVSGVYFYGSDKLNVMSLLKC
uniref:NADH dehydrogenase subunit 4L n=1 Tax=Ornithodoros tartakovskyi TaxID=570969 RepID=UPI0022383545|nr:NADH dehydrogenase subunit 4L [Ornithodoros tartakovskyi]UYB78674.1 NADH dehydrogenase subunit 4L [Ornithodoros tartakovskyi]UYB78687.1 NADH dehydrogenase subunit 4L [Ornithodoros tartakovskyi]